MDEDARRRHSTSFGAAAIAYAEHRPDYARAALRWAPNPRPVRGCSTSARAPRKLTATLAEVSDDVTAVEPDPAMLAELRRTLPGVRALSGSAEAIPLPDASVDAVVAGNAMHWFDMAVAGPEIARVLSPAVSWPGCGTSWTTGSTGSPGSRRAAEAPPSAPGHARELARRDGGHAPAEDRRGPVRLARAGGVPARAAPHRRLARGDARHPGRDARHAGPGAH
ncbi:class I SAM-dependent methyltransferase [Micromonospora sp. BRA006-A]|nr:class I SAM-dependent methyltransferase [Micromonospora sp. BRA006-A]